MHPEKHIHEARETKKAVCARLRRIAGQVQAVERMVDADRSCIELMHQLAAVQAAIGKTAEVILRSHVQIYVSDAIRSGDERECARKVEELVAVIGRYQAHARAVTASGARS